LSIYDIMGLQKLALLYMKIAFYAHKWHYIDQYEPALMELEARGVDFDIIIIFPRDDAYKRYKNKYGVKLKEPYYEKFGNFFFSPRYIPIFLRNFSKVLFFKKKLEKLFRDEKYDILVANDDRAILPCIALSVAKKFGAKTLVYPVETILFTEDFIADRIAADAPPTLKRKLMSYIAEKIYPANFIKHGNKKLYHTHPRQVMELFFFRLFPENPWLRGTNKNTDISAVNSEFQKSEDIARGASEKKIRVTGFPPYDILKKPRADLKISDKKIFLIIGTNYISHYIEQNEYNNFDQETNAVLEAIIYNLPNNWTFIFKVHPQRNLEEQKNSIREDLRNKIIFVKSEYTVYDLVSASDASLNFMSSATIAAFATYVPIFCYYLVRKVLSPQNWSARYKSIVQVSTPDELKIALLKMQKNKLLGGRVKELRQIDRDRYGKFDGQNTQRFIKLLGLEQ